jgi:putative addiction module killer protein
MKKIEIYVARSGCLPFVTWLESLKDKTIRYRIKERLDRVKLGNYGDHKPISEGVWELRFSFGAGYRVYFGEKDNTVVLLLCGGDK